MHAVTAPPAEAPPPRPLRAVVVDDEPLSRRAMRQLLDARPDVEVVAECASAVGLDAVVGRADVLFLDVEMPGRSGLELARTVAEANGGAGGGPPLVVFVTAYDEYALPAFDACAVDYLTKPVAPARLERAMARVHGRLAAAAALAERSTRPRAPAPARPEPPAAAPAASPPTSLVARVGPREVIVPLAAVTLLEADGVYTAVHVAGRRHLVRRALDELEHALAPAHFLRVHRSYLVRRSAIVEARLGTAARRRELVLAGGTVVPVSRRRQAAVARALRTWS
ncbi:DNA-binding response regulator [Gemmatimonadetes bacterium T265]|nr:DNA-binding response regulator [Gemmatimonadetes bacterium T265]